MQNEERERREKEKKRRSEKECFCKRVRERIADVQMDEDSIKYIYTDMCKGKRERERRANGKRIAREPKGV